MARTSFWVRPISWLGLFVTLLALFLAMWAGWYLAGGTEGLMLGAALYLVYSVGSRLAVGRLHRRAMALVKRERYAEAIPLFQESLEFFDRHTWIDRFRFVALMSSAAMGYGEMALLNIAFCYSQIGDGRQARSNYQECLRRYPDNRIAVAALRVLDAGATAAAD